MAHYTEIQLQPLSGEAAAQFVALKLAQLLGATTEVAPKLVERITTQAEGNPFYIEELLNYLHYQHVDFRDQAALTQIELPDSLQRLVLSLIDQLSESQKITVKVASIIGRVFGLPGSRACTRTWAIPGASGRPRSPACPRHDVAGPVRGELSICSAR